MSRPSIARHAAAILLTLAALLTPASRVHAQKSAAGRPTRIAVFDSRTVLDSMPERRGAESEFALEQAKARTMLGAATDSLRAAVEEFAKVESQMTPRQREATTMHLRARELMVEEMVAHLEQVVMRRQAELQAPLRERILQAARTVRVREGYDLVIDLASDGSIIDADARIDLTAAIIRELRSAARK
ncbi:MAG: OmpH family outer membrane protein [Gemmatimonadaceae bacterium]|nr:OmpH family outer membrane protein [Gemmatimonadaceae bacterium]